MWGGQSSTLAFPAKTSLDCLVLLLLIDCYLLCLHMEKGMRANKLTSFFSNKSLVLIILLPSIFFLYYFMLGELLQLGSIVIKCALSK